MSVSRKILVFLLAFSILNQSIDFDYITYGFGVNEKDANYDDIDSILELVVEHFTGDSDFTPEDTEDNGIPQHKGVEKHNTYQYFESEKKIKVENKPLLSFKWFPGMDQSNKICQGYTQIISPPPKTV